MSGVFVYSDSPKLAAELVGLAQTLGDPVVLVSLGQVAPGLTTLGATQVLVLKSDDEVIENYSRPLAELLQERKAKALLVGDTIRGRDLAARVAGHCRAGMISGASHIAADGGGFTAQRSTYGGKLIETGQVEELAVLTVGAGAATPLTVGGESPIDEVTVETDRRVILIERADAGGGQADLTTAPAVVGVGLGVSDQADLAQLEVLAKLLGGGVSCSRGVCEERGWFDQYIGVSGLNLSPDLYLAVGISGQIQHLYGVREAKLIAAVNINKDAPIFRNADYGIVGDYRSVVPQLIAALS